MSRPVRSVFAMILLLAGIMPGWAQADDRPFDPVGRWRFFHTDGTPFAARLSADQTAATNFGGGEHGIWRWEGNAVRMIYTDGWDDLVALAPDGQFTKRGWGPDADRCGPASNQAKAERLSSDPGPPL
ncbi:MAG: hypothetical protein WDN25_09540 [Acetobacteraceae bacterium]